MAESIEISFALNGREVRDTVPPDKTLLWFLRERMHETGTKNGCAKGHCGACTVVVDGKAMRSCVVFLRSEKLRGASVETIEGLSRPDGALHPIQQAFVDCGAVQCGFCTPGMIMAAHALLLEKPDPTDDEIRRHFTKGRNICRCTGYVKIVEAVKDAARRLRGERSPREGSPDDMSLRRSEATEKVTGRLRYGDDFRLEGMVYGKILWAAHPHAVVKAIDTSLAEQAEGVVAVVTHRDVKGTNRIGLVERDMPAMVEVGGRVRFVGDPIAGVFAESEGAAAAALDKIRVDYDVLPVVDTIEDAMAPGAPLLHEEKGTNLFHHVHIERGDVEDVLKSCAVLEEGHFSTARIEHAFMEPETGVAHYDEEGRIVLELPTQCVFDDRAQLSEALDIPKEKMRVIQLPMGGCFGAKEEIILHTFLVLGLLETGRPVKMTLTREESLRVHQKRHPAWMHYRLGADGEGRFLALDVTMMADKGAYASLGIDILENMAVFAGGPYYIPAVRIDAKSWHTNKVMSGAMRGFGANQVGFAIESMVDRVARRLGVDPIDLRLKNALETGLPTVTDHVLEPGVCGIRETLLAVKAELARTAIPAAAQGKRIGVGIASGVKNIGFGHDLPESAGAIVEMDTSGNVTVKVTHHEYGQGAWMGEIGIASETLGVPREKIAIVGPDTAQTLPTGPSTASRQTYLTGNAVVGACRNLLAEIRTKAAQALGLEDPACMELEGDSLVAKFTGARVALRELGDGFSATFRSFPGRTKALLPAGEKSLYGMEGFRSRPTHWCYAYGTQAAVVEVDETTGDVQVLKVIASHDVGRIINRRAVEAQIEGGVVMGVGYALTEEFVVKDGVNLTNTLLKCGLVTADRAPEVVVLPVEIPHPDGPLGLKGLAEAPSLPTAPAVINAIYNAASVRIDHLPATRARVLEALIYSREASQAKA